MEKIEITDPDSIASLVGTAVGPTEWREVTQEMIDSFAQLTGDHQWIHVDVERAEKESPFGTTIAHGNLTLSIIDGFREGLVDVSRDAFALGVNLGWNRVRFPAPVPAGSRIRASAELISSEQRDDGWIENVTRFTLEVEGGEKPCCVADSVTRLLKAG
ncbi:MAG: MaoC family dehydratase [Solirubrobacterales bacterium]